LLNTEGVCFGDLCLADRLLKKANQQKNDFEVFLEHRIELVTLFFSKIASLDKRWNNF